ncbi:nicotinate-nucleotide adenylyltransferase [Proteocatella sphenisci]|uniref:nicotinate-nucleotide adenylyltransferase n=1 Tax=Proteocatella sphenisci TaxID=181070 RepID=UPI00048BD126|nr:nicotinate-nucleotide adenylyltransferase [Proteocatella sphenisci]
MKKIGILGGTFNPIHSMHIKMADKSKELLKLNQVIFIPSANPPHKSGPEIESFHHRFSMVELAIDGIEGFSVSNIENKINNKKSYTVDTLRALKLIYPGDKLYFIVGSDCVFQVESWNNPNEILKLCELIVFERPEVSTTEELFKKIDYLEKKHSTKIHYIGAFTDNVSSSEIRDKINGDFGEINGLNNKIIKYIKTNNLYKEKNEGL